MSVVPTNPQRAVVLATEEEHARLSELLKTADVPKAVRRVYALQNLTFAEAQDRLKPLLEKELKGARLGSLPGNPKALLLEAPEAEHALFAEILKALDVPAQTPTAPQEATLRRLYPLRFAEAEKVAPFLAREVPGIVVQTVPGQPVLSVRGTERQLAEVESLLAQIDRAPEQGPPVFQRAYQLSNAKASDLAKVLQEALQAQRPQAQGQAQTPTRQATVVADERTNTLIVTGTQEDLALVEGLIPKLDQAVPQVNLRVRIQEVQSNLTRNLGLKWNTVAGGNVVASVLDSGLSLIFDSTRSLAALNILATLEALQRQGLSRALRDVNQTVLNNQTARLQSGETFLIRRVVGDRVERVPFDIGIIVEVTPQITADGQILLNIKAEVSGNVQRNPVDGDVDRFTKQVVTTTLRVRDGQTVVLGGLTSQENNQTQQGVPLLMDIPLIGELFKQRTNETTDRELLVVITADVLKEQAQRPEPPRGPGAGGGFTPAPSLQWAHEVPHGRRVPRPRAPGHHRRASRRASPHRGGHPPLAGKAAKGLRPGPAHGHRDRPGGVPGRCKGRAHHGSPRGPGHQERRLQELGRDHGPGPGERAPQEGPHRTQAGPRRPRGGHQVRAQGPKGRAGTGQCPGRRPCGWRWDGGLKLLSLLGVEGVGYVPGMAGVWAKVPFSWELLPRIEESPLRMTDLEAEAEVIRRIDQAKAEGDTLGGVIEARFRGLVPGLGSHVHWDRKLDGRLAQMALSIPAVKGVEIGPAFENAMRRGSEVHDPIYWSPERGFYRKTNRSGGLEGGMTTGEELVIRAALKPIATLMRPLPTVDVVTHEPKDAARERSDTTAVPAASVILCALSAIVLAQAYLEKFGGILWRKSRNAWSATRSGRARTEYPVAACAATGTPKGLHVAKPKCGRLGLR